jgi:hypothetical protein
MCGEQMGDLVGGRGASEEVTLRDVTTELASRGELARALDAFGDGDHTERVGQTGHVGGDRRALGVVLHALDERLVDLDHVDGKAAQLLQR